MGIFSNSSPFDADVEKATNENNTSEEWGVIMEICDKVGTSSTNAKDCLRSIVKRLHSPDPHIVLQAITLLDACINNCGKTFQLEVASRDFENEIRKVVSKWSAGDRVGDKIRNLIKKWSEADFKTDPQLSLMTSLYGRMKQEGVDLSTAPEPQSKAPRPTDPDSVTSQQEVEDIAKAIELSLKETSSPKYNGMSVGASSSSSSGGGLYPSVGAPVSSSSPEPRKVRALYDFEAAEDNELTFFTGEIIHVTDDSDANWWKGYNQRGEGLFPANFVTSNLSEATVPEKKGVQFNESVEVKTVPVTEIDEEKIDRVLLLLHEADPRSDQGDSDDMRRLEDEVTRMGPLIDAELEKVDRKHAQLTTLSSGLVEALNLYHGLMREPKPPQAHWYPPPPEFMYAPGPPPPPPQIFPPHQHHPPFHHPHNHQP